MGLRFICRQMRPTRRNKVISGSSTLMFAFIMQMWNYRTCDICFVWYVSFDFFWARYSPVLQLLAKAEAWKSVLSTIYMYMAKPLSETTLTTSGSRYILVLFDICENKDAYTIIGVVKGESVLQIIECSGRSKIRGHCRGIHQGWKDCINYAGKNWWGNAGRTQL